MSVVLSRSFFRSRSFDSHASFAGWLTTLLTLCFLLLAGHAARALALDPSTAKAVHSDLAHGRADDAIAQLAPGLAENASDAEAHNLLCRILFQEQRWDDAIRECEQAARTAPANSSFHMWLGRAYGEKASRVSFLQAYKMSQRVRSEFETSVTLDPHNADALADLGEFYTEAPSIVGGGLDKAEDMARRMEPLDAVRAHELRGRMAEQRKDAAAAETEFKNEIQVARDPAPAWTVLASFYRKHQRWDDMMTAIRNAVAADRDHGVASVYAASMLIKTNREPLLAMHLLDLYLHSQKQSEEEPAFLVHVRLGRLMEQRGDKQAAQVEFRAARSLAHDYRGLP